MDKLPSVLGESFGNYEITDHLGKGGMGDVYRARDTSLDRDVAIKVLPPEFTADTERLARFEREAKLLASLNHPNIASIYTLEVGASLAGAREGTSPSPTTKSGHFLVMELVEGEDLARRLEHGPIAVNEALSIALQITEGMEAAHERGVIHRDLKPGNVMVDDEGRVKLLDFGLAKALDPQDSTTSGSQDLSASPTLTSPMTLAGMILGTAPYMSPEQARGRVVDRRADIWAFGCVLYEMLTGRRPFEGSDVPEILSAIIQREPDFERLPAETPPAVQRLLQRCLVKDPKQRLRDIGDARLEIEGSSDLDVATAMTAAPAPGLAMRILPWLIAVVALVAAIYTGTSRREAQPSRELSMRLSISLPRDAPLAPAGSMPYGVGQPSLALTADGTRLVYLALVDGETRLQVRDMRTGETQPIPGTNGAHGPILSPNGRSVAFFAREKLMRTEMDGGQPQVLADAPFAYGGDWAPDDAIYFVPRELFGVSKVAATGGEVEVVTPRTGTGQGWPHILPGGDAMLVTAFSGSVQLVDLAKPDEPEVLIQDGTHARYIGTGHLLFARAGSLLAVPFELEGYRLTGEPVILLDDIRTESGQSGQYTVSDDGLLVYAAGLDARLGYLAWADRFGGHERLDLPLQSYGAYGISNDGRRLAVPIFDGDAQDIWIYDFDRLETPTRITFGMFALEMLWSPDDTVLIHGLNRRDLGESSYVAVAVSGGQREAIELVQGTPNVVTAALTPDGRELIFCRPQEGSQLDIWRAPIEFGPSSVSAAEPELLLGSPHLEIFPAVSPDGRWIAYASDETDRWEIYVASYPDFEGRVRVSIGGGEEARWTPDGSELIYRWGSQWFVAEVTYEPQLQIGKPRVLFEGPYLNVPGYSWDMTADGERFLIIEGPEQDKALAELVVVTNFIERLP